jgi:hypothetical protein
MQGLGKSYKEAEASQGGDFKRLPAGGYVCKIVAVKDVPLGSDPKKPDKGNYLEIIFDIAEGEYKGFYSDEFGEKHPYTHRLIRSYKEKAMGMFKGFLKAVDDSNGTNFVAAAEKDWKEQDLVGKLVGLVLGSEEYVSTMGEIRERLYVSANRSVEAIKTGDFKVPELKKVQDPVSAGATNPGGFTLDDSDIPFD